MVSKALKVAAGHYHLFHRVAPTVARAKGYFRRENLEVAISATGTDQKSLEALTRGEIDIVVDLKTPVALRARDQGQEVFLVGGFLNTYPGILVGAKGIRSVSDLRGKKIGLREPNGVTLTMSCMILKKAGMEPDGDVVFVAHTGASSFKSIAPKLDRGEIQARIAHKAYAGDFRAAGYPILADLQEYLPDGYQLRAIAATAPFLDDHGESVVGFLNGMIQAYRFMKEPKNHPEMMEIIRNSDLEFEPDMDQGMWEEEYPLIPGIPADGAVNVAGLEVILEEEKLSGRVSRAMTASRILRPQYVREALRRIAE
ncbi:MAG: ABC transporter substrate-binding protein [Deltaproteobacteria bacterium]|nr:ABC transporter substrate-binding protein [Deltaproteobacteria bacterium]MBI3061081.1 ABC transporter substrate-binding protein [Deltaproteobacteria bacterium]